MVEFEGIFRKAIDIEIEPLMVEDFARILHSGVLPGLGRSTAIAGGFKNWVIGGAYVPQSSTSGNLLLERVSVEAFTRAVSFDYDRFALAAHESRIVALSEREKFGAVGWPILKQYYSAFFAAHAVMRSRGAGVVRIDAVQAQAITATMRVYLGDDVRFSSGTYYYFITKGKNDATGETTVNFSPLKDGKGVHESFWHTFVNYIELEATRAAQLGLSDNQDFVAYSLKLKQSIMSGNTVWISKIRNEINYQHDYQSWMPISKKSISKKAIPSTSDDYRSYVRLDVTKSENPIKSFFCLCCYISELNYLIANRVSLNSKAGGSFGQKWERLIASTSSAV
ncbi:hypothetical protein [Gluconobacter cadivus]|uniref:Uncharacterized protein n=1 Tax=Gluconobacter cadivus TaxID=2728101 RepID=A0ABR9YYH2_9PROT|nr:hypothetical protein [Gluconobacter cadivus]MBF0889607.1 hypothetical protein [Gluconobacter cadivus]